MLNIFPTTTALFGSPTIFTFYIYGIFAVLFLVQISEAEESSVKINHLPVPFEGKSEDNPYPEQTVPHVLEGLNGMHKTFYKTAINQLKPKCKLDTYKENGKTMCKLVKDLIYMFNKAHNDEYLNNVYKPITNDANFLYHKYKTLLQSDLEGPIMNVNLGDFKTAFNELIAKTKDLKKINTTSRNANLVEQDDAAQKAAFKLLNKGLAMPISHTQDKEDEKMEWAYHLFGANLAVHSLEFGKDDREYIQGIAKECMEIKKAKVAHPGASVHSLRDKQA